MLTPNLYRFAVPALVLTLLPACGSEENEGEDSVETDAAVEVRFITDGARRDGQLTVSALDLWVAEVVFDADIESSSISVSEPVEMQFDALAGTASSDPVRITLEEGTYMSPYLGVELWDDATEPALVLEGTLDGVPIRFVFNSGEVFEAESERLVVAPGETYAVTITLQPHAWFRDIAGEELTVGADGVAEISETSNADIFDEVADLLDETTDGTFPGGTNEDADDSAR